jgi:hypothetical protein
MSMIIRRYWRKRQRQTKDKTWGCEMKDPYIDLASAIIKQAVDDLAAVEIKIKELSEEIREREERGDEAEVLVKTLRSLRGEKSWIMQFFRSQWFGALCDFIGLNGDCIIERIKKNGIPLGDDQINANSGRDI